MKKSVKWLIGIIGAVILTFAGLIVVSLSIPPQTDAQSFVVEPSPPTVNELLTLINAERTKVGVAPLTIDERLNASAQRKADDEVKYNYFGHVSPNDGKHGYEYINDVGIYCKTDSENLTDNVTISDNTSTQAVASWMNSKPHREALLNPKYSTTGFGIAGTQIVEHFCQTS